MSLLNQLLKHPRSEKPYTPVAFQCRYCGRVEPSLAEYIDHAFLCRRVHQSRLALETGEKECAPE